MGFSKEQLQKLRRLLKKGGEKRKIQNPFIKITEKRKYTDLDKATKDVVDIFGRENVKEISDIDIQNKEIIDISNKLQQNHMRTDTQTIFLDSSTKEEILSYVKSTDNKTSNVILSNNKYVALWLSPIKIKEYIFDPKTKELKISQTSIYNSPNIIFDRISSMGLEVSILDNITYTEDNFLENIAKQFLK